MTGVGESAGAIQPGGVRAGPVTIIGAGLAGAACAVALRSAGIGVRIVERGRAPGGRMASPELHGRRVDVGAGYFTVRDDGFAQVVSAWAEAGLAREWTDTFAVLAPGREPDTKAGPMRWAAPDGLRRLVRGQLDGVDVQLGTPIDTLPDGEVVLAMPDSQARRLIEVPDPVTEDPTVAVVCGYAERAWPFVDAAFVQDHPDVEFIADDGARRGDGAAVLVVHTTARLARRHLDQPEKVLSPVLSALADLLGTPPPSWTHIHRWTFAKPGASHPSSFGFALAPDGRRVGLAGDQWCPQGSPRVESAWRSGTDLGLELAEGRKLQQ